MDISKNAFTEVYFIINNLEDNLKKNIPSEIIEEIKKRMDREYIPNISNISPEARAMMSVIYSDYLCSEEEKKKWDDIDNLYQEGVYVRENKNITQTIDEKINLQRNENRGNIGNTNESKELITTEENKITKFFKRIKKLFSAIWRD